MDWKGKIQKEKKGWLGSWFIVIIMGFTLKLTKFSSKPIESAETN